MIKWSRRLLTLFLAAMLLCGALPASAEEELNLASQAAVLLDAETGAVLYQKNMHQVLYPASITKIMTALLAVQNLQPEAVLTVSQTAVNAVPRTSSHISLKAGERLTVEQALYAIGMESANDAANVLAEAVSGSLEAFAQLMTETAAQLGAKNTHFANANGLPDSSHTTTAYDMALITAAAWKQEGLKKYFSTVTYTLPATNLSAARSFNNKDRLLPGGQYYYDGVEMAKTGWTSSAQGTFAAVVQKGDVTLVAVTLKSPLLEDKYKDTHQLMDYGFSHYSRVKVTGERVVASLELGAFTPAANQKLSYLIPAGESVDDISFALEPLDWEGEKRERVKAAVYASIGELRLPDGELTLTQPHKERGEAFTLSELLQGRQVQMEDLPPAVRTLIVIALIVLLAVFLLWLKRQIQRHRRRRHLKARIKRMKKRMQ